MLLYNYCKIHDHIVAMSAWLTTTLNDSLLKVFVLTLIQFILIGLEKNIQKKKIVTIFALFQLN